MERILFLVDSAGDLTKEQTEGKPIWVVPVVITYNGRSMRDFYDIDTAAFWRELSYMDEVPATTQITPDSWLEIYRKAQHEGYTHLILVTLSSTASGIYNSACIAGQMLRDEGSSLEIAVLDSKNYSFLYGRTVLIGCEEASRGAGFSEVVARMRDVIAKTTGYLWVYTLKYLKASGRITGMASFVGDALGIRPVLKLGDGAVVPVDRVRGEKNLIPRAVKLIKQYAADIENQDIVLLYADVPEEEIALAEETAMRELKPKSITRQPIGPTISINTGPNAMAFIFEK